MARRGKCRVVADGAEEAGILHDDTGGLAIDQPRQVLALGGIGIGKHGLEADEPPVAPRAVAVVRMQVTGEDRLPSPRDAVRHHHRLGAGGGAVVHRGVGHIHARKQRDLRLELEQHLQRALRHLGLVGRVGGQELAALDQVIDRSRHVMAIDAGADEARNRACGQVLRCHGGECALDLELALSLRQIEETVEARGLRHIGEERVDRGHADRCQHRLAVGGGEGQVAHQPSPSTNFLYCASSMRASSSLALAMLILKNQPPPMGSALTRPGSPASSVLTSVTWPLSGA